MTKFEEELFNKVPCKINDEAEYKKSTLINHFKNWHSDDEYQELLDKYSNLNDNYEKEVIRSSKLESQLISREKQVIELREDDKAQGKEIIQLKSQLQQQTIQNVHWCPVGAVGKNGLTKEEIIGVKYSEKSIASILNGEEHKCTPECFEKHVIKAIQNDYDSHDGRYRESLIRYWFWNLVKEYPWLKCLYIIDEKIYFKSK